MNTNERTVHFYDLIAQSKVAKKGISSPSCASLHEILQAIEASNPKRTVLTSRQNVIIELVDWLYDPRGFWKILINRADRRASEIVFKDFDTRKSRKAGKRHQDGIDCSAHIIIKTSPGSPKGLLLVTMGSGVSIGTIESGLRLLTKAIQNAKHAKSIFEFKDPCGGVDESGVDITYKVRYGFECVGHKGGMLDNALKSGNFIGMDLIGHDSRRFDSAGNLNIKRQILSVEVGKAPVVTPALIKNSILSFNKSSSKKHHYDQVKISYKNGVGRRVGVTLPTSDLDTAFTKKEVVKLSMDVDQQQESLSPVIIDAMAGLL